MKAIVTGGAGFIGSHVVDNLLAKKAKVVVIDNLSTGRKKNLEHVKNEIEFIECDIGVKGNWIKVFDKTDWVIHLAALADVVPSIHNPQDYFHSNVNGTFNVLEAAKSSKVKRFIYIASSSCYGIPDYYPTPETANISPQYPYALTKWLGEELVLHWAQVYKLPALSLRLFNVYGPRSRTSGTYGAVFGVFLAQKLAGEPFTVVGDGNQTRDFTYVSDIVNAILSAAYSKQTRKIYNVGSGKTIAINRLVELLGGEKVFIPKRPGEPDCTFANISRIKSELYWQPKIAIEEGVKKLLENINYWKEAPVWNPESIADATKDWFHYLGSKKSE